MAHANLVSVIIPTFKRSDYLVKAIKSVLGQTYKDIELIIVDDNDGDNDYRKVTKTLLQNEFPEQPYTYLEHTINKGLAAARNTGSTVAKGEYLAFLDDDDIWFPEKIEKQIDLFNQLDQSYGIIACNWKIIDVARQTEKIRKIQYRGEMLHILGLNHFAPPSMIVVKRHYFELVNGFDEEFRWRQDIELYYRLAPHCKFDFVDEVLVDYFKHEGQMSYNFEKKLEHVKKFIAKHHDTLKQHKLPWSELHEHLGDLYAYNGLKFYAAKNFLEAFFVRPTHLSLLIKLIGVLLLSKAGYKNFRNVK